MSVPTFAFAGTAGQPAWNPGQALYIQNPDGSFTHLSPGQLTHIEQTQPGVRIYSSSNATQPTTTVADQTATQSDQLSAKGIIAQTLDAVGLGSLGSWAWQQYLTSGSVDYVMSQLPNQPQFQTMYPDYQQLAKNGVGMSVQQLHDYNVQMTQLASQFNLPAGFATPQIAAQYRLKGWNISAVQEQFKEASAIVNNQLPQEDLNYLQNEIGLSKGDLAAYWINPDHALPLLQNKLASAQIGGAAARQGINLNQDLAAQLANQGVSGSQADQGFGHMATDQQLFHPLPGQPGQSFTQAQQVGAEFGTNGAAQQALAQARSDRLAPFQARGGFTGNSQGLVGAGTAIGT